MFFRYITIVSLDFDIKFLSFGDYSIFKGIDLVNDQKIFKHNLKSKSTNQFFITGRKGIDLVNDNPENSLMREVDTIKSCQNKMRQTLEQVSENYSRFGNGGVLP